MFDMSRPCHTHSSVGSVADTFACVRTRAMAGRSAKPTGREHSIEQFLSGSRYAERRAVLVAVSASKSFETVSPLANEGARIMKGIGRSGIFAAILATSTTICFAQVAAPPAQIPAQQAAPGVAAAPVQMQGQPQSACGNQALCMDTPD